MSISSTNSNSNTNSLLKAGGRHYASYYSGTDIGIYFGDKWIDEVVEIEWSLQEQVAPIYGYASYTWDKVARGSRFVTGSFAINFKEAGYLQTILNSLSSQETDQEWFNLSEFNGQKQDGGAVANSHKGVSVETVIENFQELADDYEAALWGTTSDSAALIESRKTDSFFYGSNQNKNNNALKEHGFNIFMTFGGTQNQKDWARGNWGFNTAQTIVGVQLTGVSSRVDPSGQPIAEVYSFIAKDISGNVQKSANVT